MINWIIWFWVFLCPNPNHTFNNHGNCGLIHVSTNSLDDDTGGETGGIPRPPVPPPPPPPGTPGG
ncbi:MAG TPA: hypothetical protein VF487_08255 [Chitinophagaceae bacterium]